MNDWPFCGVDWPSCGVDELYEEIHMLRAECERYKKALEKLNDLLDEALEHENKISSELDGE